MSYIGNSPGVASQRVETAFTATSNQTAFTPSSGYTLGYCDVYQNGVKLVNGDDYTASDGATVTLATGAASGDSIVIVASFPRGLSDGYLKSEADAKYVALTGDQTVAGVKTFSSQIVGIAGTAGAPAVTTTGDLDTGIFFPAANTLAFSTNGTEDARFDANGNLLVGYTSPYGVSGGGTNRGTFAFDQAGRTQIAISNQTNNAAAGAALVLASYGADWIIENGSTLKSSNALSFLYGTSEKARIDSSGNFGIGTTSSGNNRFISRYNTGGTDPTESIGAFVLGNDATFTGGILRVKNAGNRGARGHANGSGLFNFEFSDAAGASLDKDGVFCIGKTGWNHNSGFVYHPALYSSGVGVLELAANSNSNSQTALQLYSNSDSTYKFYVQWDGETYIAGPLKLAQPTNAKNEIKVGSLPSWGTSGKTFFTAVGEYGYSNNGLILQCGYDDGGDVGGIKITDDGICMWGAGDEDLLRIYNEDTNVLALQIADNNNAVFSGSVTPNSDESLKTNWRDVCEDFVEQLANLKHGIYDRTDMTEKDGTPYTQVGVGAQSLETFFPEGVYRSKTTGLLGVDYGGVAMVSAVELAKEVVALKAIIEQLQADVATLKGTP